MCSILRSPQISNGKNGFGEYSGNRGYLMERMRLGQTNKISNGNNELAA